MIIKIFYLRKQLTNLTLNKNLSKFLTELSEVILHIGSSAEGELLVIDQVILFDTKGIEHKLFDTLSSEVGEAHLRNRKAKIKLRNKIVNKFSKFSNELEIKKFIIYYHLKFIQISPFWFVFPN